jgi:hypothetical protein
MNMLLCDGDFEATLSHEGPEGGGGEGVSIPFPTWNFRKIPVPVAYILEIPVWVIEIPDNKKI